MDKIKILQINKLYYPVTGGIERVVQQIAEGLKEKTDMEVLVCRNRGKTVTEDINGVKITRAGSLGILSSMPISLAFISKLRKLSKDKDVLHFHMPFPLGDLACLLSGYKGKVVVWWHSDIVRQKKLMKLYRPIMERFLKRADVIIVATQGHIDGSDYLPGYRDKCAIIPFGVEPMIEYRGAQYLKKAVPIHKDKINLLFVGRFVYYKGCEVLLRAVSQVDGIELTMVGSGELEAKLKEEAVLLGIQNRINFRGNLDENELNKAFEDCDVFVLPSVLKSEAFGLVQIEAMAYGKPVINTKLPSGVPYVSIDHLTGLTVPPDDVQALANAIQWMVEHEDERIEMGRRARERVEECYQMNVMLNRIMYTYESLIEI
ncbi:MAG: glycosyltransferase [Anaerocolumna sp.]